MTSDAHTPTAVPTPLPESWWLAQVEHQLIRMAADPRHDLAGLDALLTAAQASGVVNWYKMRRLIRSYQDDNSISIIGCLDRHYRPTDPVEYRLTLAFEAGL